MYRVGNAQGQWLGSMTGDGAEEHVRSVMALLAEQVDGLTNQDQGYYSLIAPGESTQMRRDMSKMWACGLTVRGLLRLLGLMHPSLEAPYRIGQAIADVEHIGRKLGALVPSAKVQDLKRGWVALIRPDNPHILTVVENSNGLLTSIDGGQVDKAGNTCIAKRSRKHEGIRMMWALDTGKLHKHLTLEWFSPLKQSE